MMSLSITKTSPVCNNKHGCGNDGKLYELFSGWNQPTDAMLQTDAVLQDDNRKMPGDKAIMLPIFCLLDNHKVQAIKMQFQKAGEGLRARYTTDNGRGGITARCKNSLKTTGTSNVSELIIILSTGNMPTYPLITRSDFRRRAAAVVGC